MSAPSSTGRCRYEDAKVLSTTSSAPTACAASAAAWMSTTFSSGLVGVSIHTSRVSASRCAARSVLQVSASRYSKRTPRGSYTFENSR